MIANVIFTKVWLQDQMEDLIKPFGLSHQEFDVMRVLRVMEGLSMNGIKSMMVDKPRNMTRLCDEMIEKKLLERLKNEEHKGVVQLKLSEQGLELLKKINEYDASIPKKFMDNITEAEAEIVNHILDKMRRVEIESLTLDPYFDF